MRVITMITQLIYERKKCGTALLATLFIFSDCEYDSPIRTDV